MRERIGQISLCGDRQMRVLLYEAAQIMMTRETRWSWLKAWAMKIAVRRGQKKAIVARPSRLVHGEVLRGRLRREERARRDA